MVTLSLVYADGAFGSALLRWPRRRELLLARRVVPRTAATALGCVWRAGSEGAMLHVGWAGRLM